MPFGLPYMGSKNIYAKAVCEALPSGKRLVDLFAGGCAITDCAIRKYPNKWESFLLNDINPDPLNLYAKCLCGENPVSYDWVSRDAFPTKDWATRLVWSFGNSTHHYLYSKDIEPVKKDVETWVVFNRLSNDSGVFNGITPPQLSTLIERKTWWNREGCKLALNNMPFNTELHRLENLERLQRLERLERLQRLERLERLERLQRLEFSYLSYEQYTYKEGDVVYCDIPYYNTSCKQYSDQGFSHIVFWQWAKEQSFDVYVSERTIPNDVIVVLSKKVMSRASGKGTDSLRTEYLVCV